MGRGHLPPPPGKSHVAICFLRYSGTDPIEMQLEPMGPIASRERSVPLSVNCDDDYENNIFRTHGRNFLLLLSVEIGRDQGTMQVGYQIVSHD